MATRLGDLAELASAARGSHAGISKFLEHERVRRLRWPEDVVEQWLYDHAPSGTFEADYGHIELERVQWSVEVISSSVLAKLPTGASDQGCIEHYAEDPDHWVGVRTMGVHVGVREMWETHGTWKRWPLLIDRSLVDGSTGLQVVEGRTRVGVLRGRLDRRLLVSDSHLCWVATAREGTG